MEKPYSGNGLKIILRLKLKIDRKIYHVTVDSLLKDAVITVGVSLRLCLLSLCSTIEENDVSMYVFFFKPSFVIRWIAP